MTEKETMMDRIEKLEEANAFFKKVLLAITQNPDIKEIMNGIMCPDCEKNNKQCKSKQDL